LNFGQFSGAFWIYINFHMVEFLNAIADSNKSFKQFAECNKNLHSNMQNCHLGLLVRGLKKQTGQKVKCLVHKQNEEGNLSENTNILEDAIIVLPKYPTLNNMQCSSDLQCCRPTCCLNNTIYYLYWLYLCKCDNYKYISVCNICVFL